jgi:glycosyltransferase involved in cell wall biosynthesis
LPVLDLMQGHSYQGAPIPRPQLTACYRVLLVCSHPVQYAAPLFRLMARHSKLDILVAYCSLQGAEPGLDPQFKVEVAWDIPLLEGYPWVRVPNRSPKPGLGNFVGLVNPGLWRLVRTGRFDAVLVYGYGYISFWIGILAAKSAGIPIILATDAVRLESPRGGWWWKRWVKTPVVRFIYRLADFVAVPSTASRKFLRSLGIPDERLALAPNAVDNDHFARAAAGVDPAEVRQRWRIPVGAFVILFCGKLTTWKRPQDLLQAFASLFNSGGESESDSSAYLVFCGEGPLRKTCEADARSLGMAERVRFLGFVNQLQLPEVYAASDLLVLPSEFETWGLVLNEAMACGVPAVVSDRVGARLDLISPGITGEVYPVGDAKALAGVLRSLISHPDDRKRMGQAARMRLRTWSYQEHLQGFVEAVESAVSLKRAPRT